MGCGSSKDATADLAGNFFGEEPTPQRSPMKQRDLSNTPIMPPPPAPEKSALAKKNTPPIDTPDRKPRNSNMATKGSPGGSGSKQRNSGRPKSAMKESARTDTPQARPGGSKPQSSPSPPISTPTDRINNRTVRASNKKANTKKQTRKTDYIAPPSSESFVTPDVAVGSQPIKVRAKAAAMNDKSEFAPPPPPPKDSTSTSNHPNSYSNEETKYVDDDDFSVAPSLATSYRSVVKISFDQIYDRGQKVSAKTYSGGKFSSGLSYLTVFL